MNEDIEIADATAGIVERVGKTVSSGVDGLRRSVVDAPVFGVHEVEGRQVITAASVNYSGGFGFGGGGPGSEVRTIGAPADGGGGGGGGGGGQGRPIAVIDVAGGEVRIHPVVDWTKIGAAIVAALVTMWVAARRGRRG